MEQGNNIAVPIKSKNAQQFDVMAAGQTVISQDVVIIPKLLEECAGCAHVKFCFALDSPGAKTNVFDA